MSNTLGKCHDRVLRKRNKPPQALVFEKIKNNVLNTSSKNVWDEHNYFHRFDKKICRWPVKKKSTLKVILPNDNYESLPEWLTESRNSSEEEDCDEVQSLAYILKAELKNDLECEIGLFGLKKKKC